MGVVMVKMEGSLACIERGLMLATRGLVFPTVLTVTMMT